MGYRSEVKSCIYADAEKIAKFKSNNSELIERLSEDFGSEITQFNNGSYEFIYLDCSYSKWYDSFTDVVRWHELLSRAEEVGICTEFVRVGEDREGDIEQIYTGVDCLEYLTPKTTIDVGFLYYMGH